MTRPRAAVLILEEDTATLELYRRELGTEYTVLTCGDERTAFELLRDTHVAALVLEPATLEDDLWQFLSVIRALPGYGRTPVVICSTVDERRRRAELGVATYLVKPVMPRDLHVAVQQALTEVDA